MPELLIELLSEEIPARMQARAGDDLRRLVTDRIVEAGLTYAAAAAFTTPRRLMLAVDGLAAGSFGRREERRGPKVGAPDKAIDGFCRSANVLRDDLQVRDDKKGQVYVAMIDHPGRPAADIVAEALEATIREFPWPKSMRWGDGDLRWVRPLHAILCVITDETGTEIVPLTIDGITAGDTTRGHPFMAPAPFRVTGFDDYAAKLRRAHVILSPEDRAEHIRHAITTEAFARGLDPVDDSGLLAEVAGLVEWPVVLIGVIGSDFLHLPAEVLQTSMKEHQKFFSLRDAGQGQITHFATVANREAQDDGATILEGNARVLSARLADAAFFWERDLSVAKAGMTEWTNGLASVTFHAKLGSQADRVGRIAALSREIAPMVGADPDLAAQAARVAKADLRSEMVGEFPELQGLMGRYYSEAAGFPPEVAAACADHYAPLGPSDAVPTAPVSIAVALADKIDTLAGFWAVDEKPTGSKDPFALRRAGLGVLRTILENDLRMDLAAPSGPLMGALCGEQTTPLVIDLLAFLHDRLKVHMRDRDIPQDVIDACLARPGNDDLTLLTRRAKALAAFRGTEDGENLVQGFKRANNILTQAEDADGVEYSFGPEPKLAETDAERELFAALDREGPAIRSALAEEDFDAAMRRMAAMRAPIDAFFDAVQVNTDNQTVRRNRLNMLHVIRETCLQVADLTRLQG